MYLCFFLYSLYILSSFYSHRPAYFYCYLKRWDSIYWEKRITERSFLTKKNDHYSFHKEGISSKLSAIANFYFFRPQFYPLERCESRDRSESTINTPLGHWARRVVETWVESTQYENILFTIVQRHKRREALLCCQTQIWNVSVPNQLEYNGNGLTFSPVMS